MAAGEDGLCHGRAVSALGDLALPWAPDDSHGCPSACTICPFCPQHFLSSSSSCGAHRECFRIPGSVVVSAWSVELVCVV